MTTVRRAPTIRFAVRDDLAGRRASSWKCFAPPRKNDVYLTCRELDGAVKASLHESGEWSIAYEPAFYDRAVRDEDTTVRGRFIYEWARPQEIAAGVTLALRIITPWSAVTMPARASRPLLSIPAPPDGRAIETLLFLLDPRVSPEGWPCRDSMNSKPVGAFALPDGHRVSVVWLDIPMPTFPPLHGTPRFYRGASAADLRTSGGLRMLLIGDHVDGSKALYDVVAKHRDAGAAGGATP